MDDLARRLIIARADAIAHQQMLNALSNVDLLVIIDDFLTVGIDHDAEPTCSPSWPTVNTGSRP